LQCSGACDVPKGIGVLIGATLTAAGMGIVSVLVLRALGVWKELQDK
jgi:hypothetical protein